MASLYTFVLKPVLSSGWNSSPPSVVLAPQTCLSTFTAIVTTSQFCFFFCLPFCRALSLLTCLHTVPPLVLLPLQAHLHLTPILGGKEQGVCKRLCFFLGNGTLEWVLREIPSLSWAFPPPGVFLEGSTVSQWASLMKTYIKRAPRLAVLSAKSNSMRSNGKGNCKLFENM